jgi:hypothetical protein
MPDPTIAAALTLADRISRYSYKPRLDDQGREAGQRPAPEGRGMSELMTAAEHRAMDLTVDLWNLLAGEVIGRGPARGGDCAEMAASIHAIQERILAQAAARAYPDRYRLLGGWPLTESASTRPDPADHPTSTEQGTT